MNLPDEIRQLEQDAPRLYSRWSSNTWRLACEGPALRLWESLSGAEGAAAALGDYLRLLREAVGLQYLSASRPEELDPHSACASFMSVAFSDTLPRLLPKAEPARRAEGMARLWNAAERLASKPVWLNRYLAARLLELTSLDGLEGLLTHALEEGLDEAPEAQWLLPMHWSVADLAPFDRDFLPGPLHLATPSIVCVHDRRRKGRQIALLLRRAARGGPLCLGVTPCLGSEDAPPAFELPPGRMEKPLADASLPEPLMTLATKSGHLLLSTALSQRLWIGESRG